jgi:hypothetical protein
MLIINEKPLPLGGGVGERSKNMKDGIGMK